MKPPPIHLRRCSDCDASSNATATRCWLCGRPLTPGDEIIVAELVPDRSHDRLEPLFAVLTLASVGLSLLLIAGAARNEPAIAMYVAICVGPALLATAIRAAGRRALGKPLSWQSMFLTFFVSVTAVLAIFGLLLVAVIILLFAICLRAFQSM